MQIIKLPTNEITIPENRLIEINKENLTNLINSIEKRDLIHPITVTKEKVLICGHQRLLAFKKLGIETIPCIIRNENQLKEELLQIDENLVRNKLTPFQEQKLLARRKEIYEYENPTSTKAFKSKNNSLVEDERVETEESFSSSTAKELGCSTKSITDKIACYSKICNSSPSLEESITKFDTKNKISGIELTKISKLSPEEMDNVSNVLNENMNKKDFKISDILKANKTVEKSMKEKLHDIFMYDLLFVSKNLSMSAMQKAIVIDSEEAEKFKNELNVDFTNEISFLIKNIK